MIAMGKVLVGVVSALLIFTSCSDDNKIDNETFTPVSDYWHSVAGLTGRIEKDSEHGDWVFYPSTPGSRELLNLGEEEGAVMTVTNWDDAWSEMCEGCSVDGLYKKTGVKSTMQPIAVTSYYNLQIKGIRPYDINVLPHEPEPEPEKPGPEFVAGRMIINTTGGAAITSKEDYVECTVAMEHDNEEWNLSATTGGIRGRGNSTWLWYPKKPYRIKLDKKKPMLGLPEAKSWVLLAEYRDPTKLMNAFVFELGQLMSMPYTNHNRYVELVLNGESQGMYHLTEQVQQNKYRVNIDELGGYLIQLDKDDGPELSPTATDNFWSTRYHMPVCVKNPEELNSTVINEIKGSLAEAENAVYSGDMTRIDQVLDVKSVIDFLIIQELIYNVELDAPRSMYMHHDVGGKWTMGPLWDFDAGFDFDWTNMTQSHNYFANYKELVLGTNPATHAGTQYRVPGFFSDLFKIADFKTLYKARWQDVKPLVEQAMTTTKRYYTSNGKLWSIDMSLWPIGKNSSNEIGRMTNWLTNRVGYLDSVIAEY